jgi:hypothetical protein
LENLKSLMESKDLWVELKPGRLSYMVLKGTYGEKIHKTFRMTRQGVKTIGCLRRCISRDAIRFAMLRLRLRSAKRMSGINRYNLYFIQSQKWSRRWVGVNSLDLASQIGREKRLY